MLSSNRVIGASALAVLGMVAIIAVLHQAPSSNTSGQQVSAATDLSDDDDICYTDREVDGLFDPEPQFLAMYKLLQAVTQGPEQVQEQIDAGADVNGTMAANCYNCTGGENCGVPQAMIADGWYARAFPNGAKCQAQLCGIDGGESNWAYAGFDLYKSYTPAGIAALMDYCTNATGSAYGGYMPPSTSLYNQLCITGNCDSWQGCNPNFRAASHGTSQNPSGAMELLINAGADVNIPNSDGQTPLMFAVLSHDIGLVNVLREGGADINANGGSALSWVVHAITSGVDYNAMLEYIIDNPWTPPLPANTPQEVGCELYRSSKAKPSKLKNAAIKIMKGKGAKISAANCRYPPNWPRGPCTEPPDCPSLAASNQGTACATVVGVWDKCPKSCGRCVPKTCPSEGILNTKQQACCPKECGQCGGKACGDAPGGPSNCCSDPVLQAAKSCDSNAPPCAISWPAIKP